MKCPNILTHFLTRKGGRGNSPASSTVIIRFCEEIIIIDIKPARAADYNFANLVPAVATVKGDRLGDCISVNRSQSYVNSNANANYSNQQE